MCVLNTTLTSSIAVNMARHIVATLARLGFIIVIVQAGICILGLLWLKTVYMKFGKLLECNINFEFYSKY